LSFPTPTLCARSSASTSWRRRCGKPPIIDLANPDVAYVNPLPSALILTGIVVSVSVTALSLALVVRIHRQYGTIDADEIAAIRSAEDV